ncbi:MAG: hypothetical protein KJ645_01365 [Planctomycetes bacterium]|nr:hypothetical protein [Planctomycetota bacterium]
MSWLRAIVWGPVTGVAFMLSLYAWVLFALRSKFRVRVDEFTDTLIADFGDQINTTTLRFLVLNLLAGCLLGAAGAVLFELLLLCRGTGIQVRRFGRFAGYLFADIAVFFYLNLRFMACKPAFYDALLNLRGGPGRWFQNLWTNTFSPAGVDLLFIFIHFKVPIWNTLQYSQV